MKILLDKIQEYQSSLFDSIRLILFWYQHFVERCTRDCRSTIHKRNLIKYTLLYQNWSSVIIHTRFHSSDILQKATYITVTIPFILQHPQPEMLEEISGRKIRRKNHHDWSIFLFRRKDETALLPRSPPSRSILNYPPACCIPFYFAPLEWKHHSAASRSEKSVGLYVWGITSVRYVRSRGIRSRSRTQSSLVSPGRRSVVVGSEE